MTLPVSYEASARLPGLSRCGPTGAEAPTGHRGPASPGVRDLYSPLHRHILRASTPGPDASRRPKPAAPKSHGPTAPPVQHLVPPSWFRTTSTAFSARRTAGLLHPATGPGVRRVSLKPAPTTRLPPRGWGDRQRRPVGPGRGRPRFPRRFDPSKSSPRSQPYGVSTACSASVPSGAPPGGDTPRSPLPVGGSGVCAMETLDFEALLRERVRCVRHPCGHLDRSFLPWACVPF
jgi:hypothetical protein